jgi:hypothetical protein
MTEPDSGFLVSPLAAYFDEHLPDALAWFRSPGPDAGTLCDDFGECELLIDKKATVIALPDELAMDYGLIPDTRERKPVTRRTRFRWWRSRQRERAASLAYRLIAGYDPPEPE